MLDVLFGSIFRWAKESGWAEWIAFNLSPAFIGWCVTVLLGEKVFIRFKARSCLAAYSFVLLLVGVALAAVTFATDELLRHLALNTLWGIGLGALQLYFMVMDFKRKRL